MLISFYFLVDYKINGVRKEKERLTAGLLCPWPSPFPSLSPLITYRQGRGVGGKERRRVEERATQGKSLVTLFFSSLSPRIPCPLPSLFYALSLPAHRREVGGREREVRALEGRNGRRSDKRHDIRSSDNLLLRPLFPFLPPVPFPSKGRKGRDKGKKKRLIIV